METDATRVAFLGLGQMGAPMAGRLLEAGHDLVVWNRTPERAEPLVDRGARQASSPAEAAAGAEVCITMVATPEALEGVVFGGEGLASGLREGSTVLEMSTVGVDAVRAVAERLSPSIEVLDAPVLGSVAQAEEGRLRVFVGGSDASFDRWRSLLEVLGDPMHLGPLGSGAAMKLVANSTLGALMTGLGEALALADALGLDEGAVLEALAESPIGATVKSKRDRIESASYPPNFKLALAAKDMRLVSEAAAQAGVDVRLAPAAQSWLEAAEEAGLGDLDYSAVVARIRGQKIDTLTPAD